MCKDVNKISMVETLVTLAKLLADPEDLGRLILVLLLLAGCFYLDIESKLLTGHVLTMLSTTDANVMKGVRVTDMVCAHVMDCEATTEDTSLVDNMRKALLVGFIVVKTVQSLLHVANVYVHHNACAVKNAVLCIASFNKMLTLDQAFFDTRSMTDIRQSMEGHSINNLITWNIPYLIGLAMKLVMTVYFMAMINFRLALSSVACMLLIKYGVLDPIGRREKLVQKIGRKYRRMNNQVKDETCNMIMYVKLHSKEGYHEGNHTIAQHRWMSVIGQIVNLRCAREFGYRMLKTATFGVILYQGLSIFKESNLRAGDLSGFFLLFQEFQELLGRLK